MKTLNLEELQKEFRLDEEEMKGLQHLVKTSGKPMTMQEARIAIIQMIPLGLLRDMAEYTEP